jgi:hypothetical protein
MTLLASGLGRKLFKLERLVSDKGLSEFDCKTEEYNVYLARDALKAQSDMVSVTYLLKERKSGLICAYMSLIADAIKLNAAEKELHNLQYPFKTMPAMKIAKLAVSQSSSTIAKGIGSYMVAMATGIAINTYEDRFACRFLTVDADVENDTGVIEFYFKNGFALNAEMNNKRSVLINMRKDLYIAQ